MLPSPALESAAGVNPSKLFDLVEAIVVNALRNRKEGL
jgi:hypothetical protein